MTTAGAPATIGGLLAAFPRRSLKNRDARRQARGCRAPSLRVRGARAAGVFLTREGEATRLKMRNISATRIIDAIVANCGEHSLVTVRALQLLQTIDVPDQSLMADEALTKRRQ
jgi:hypothetical protein